MTLTATVDAKNIRYFVRTVYTTSYSSPAAKEAGEKPTLSPSHHSTPGLSLADPKERLKNNFTTAPSPLWGEAG